VEGPDPIGGLGDLAAVRDEEDRAPLLAREPEEEVQDLPPVLLVEVPGGLVGEQEPRPPLQGAAQRDPLHLPAR
jgi:hypothetical protein